MELTIILFSTGDGFEPFLAEGFLQLASNVLHLRTRRRSDARLSTSEVHLSKQRTSKFRIIFGLMIRIKVQH